MLLKFSAYIFCLLILFSLPERFFPKFYFKLRLTFKTGVNLGNDLLLALLDFENNFTFKINKEKQSLPQFKFYTALLERLLEAHRQEGISIRNIIPDLRAGIQKDIQFENKVQKEMIGGYFQFFIITVTTWSFIFFSKQLIQIKMNFTLTFLIISLECLGFILFYFLFNWMKKKQFLPFSSAFSELYLFHSLIEVRLPIKTIIADSNILSGVLISSKRFHFLAKRIVSSVERWKTSGTSPKAESEELIKELWYLQEEGFIDFIKKLQVLKFILMATLFLPAYFIYLAGIFKFFMEQ